VDLRNWLFGFGAGIRIESPEALRDEHLDRARAVQKVYPSGG
jgi:predicted DNA-binding transcriptional regulator YafY